ncbi:MAG: Holliday junction branch migration protein RuvA [Candidatus Shapirobacteria bacterium]
MISSLTGKISKIWGNNCEVEVNGVGYLLYVNKNFLKKHAEGEEIKVATYMAVSENDISLFGFENFEEVNLFKMLISVSGVGPKTAAQILGESNSLDIVRYIGEANVEFFQKIKGIGKKTAQRIIIDLKSRIGGLGELDLSDDNEIEEDDLVASLKQLGFDKKEIEKVVKKMPKELGEIEEKLAWCLNNLGN